MHIRPWPVYLAKYYKLVDLVCKTIYNAFSRYFTRTTGGKTMSGEVRVIDRLCKVYVTLRDTISAKQAEVDALKKDNALVALALKDALLDAGCKSISTAHGLISMRKKTQYYATEWSEFDAFVIANSMPGLFERRIAQGNLVTFMEEHPDVTVPGISSETSFSISVRAVKKKESSSEEAQETQETQT